MSDTNTPSEVLIVDDSRVIRRAAVKILDKEYIVIEAEDGEDAWDQLQHNKNISVVFTDLGMPNMDGYELLEKIRKSDDPALSNMPVIIITGAEESEGAKEEVLEMGATDFISKPFDSVSLKTRAATHINYRKQVQNLEQQVATDKLTGLLSEASFREQGDKALAYAKRHVTDLAVVRCDIDHFAEFFVKHGKDVAEQILVKVASIIREGLRKEDIAGRLGVSRFALILTSADPQGAELVISRICERVARLKVKLGKEEFHLSFSAGVTCHELSDSSDHDLEQLLGEAETRLKQAEAAGGNKIIAHQAGKPAVAKPAIAQVDVDLEALLKSDLSSLGKEQLASALCKFMPLMQLADTELKLGLGKVVTYLKKRLGA